MAKNKKSQKARTTKYSMIQVMAFVALIVAAVIWILNGVRVLDDLGGFGSVLMLARDVCLLATVALVSHNFAKSLGKVWYAIYWVVVIIAILGIIFGSFSII